MLHIIEPNILPAHRPPARRRRVVLTIRQPRLTAYRRIDLLLLRFSYKNCAGGRRLLFNKKKHGNKKKHSRGLPPPSF